VGALDRMEGIRMGTAFNGHGVVRHLKSTRVMEDMMVDGKAKGVAPGNTADESRETEGELQGKAGHGTISWRMDVRADGASHDLSLSLDGIT